jgi:hypothetical protein
VEKDTEKKFPGTFVADMLDPVVSIVVVAVVVVVVVSPAEAGVSSAATAPKACMSTVAIVNIDVVALDEINVERPEDPAKSKLVDCDSVGRGILVCSISIDVAPASMIDETATVLAVELVVVVANAVCAAATAVSDVHVCSRLRDPSASAQPPPLGPSKPSRRPSAVHPLPKEPCHDC